MRSGKYGKYTLHKDNPTSFGKGCVPWNKGMKGYQAGEKHYRYGKEVDEEMKKKISATKQGVTTVEWNGFKRSKNYLQRRQFQQKIQKQVLERDDYTCQLCLTKGGILHVDHIQPFAEYAEGRFSMNNCRTLCRSCHYEVTFKRPIPSNSTWGKSFMPSNSNELIYDGKG